MDVALQDGAGGPQLAAGSTHMPPLLSKCAACRMELVAEVLRSFAMTRPQLAAVVRGHPGVLRKE